MGRNEMIDSLKEGVNKSAPISPDVNNNSNLAQAYQYYIGLARQEYAQYEEYIVLARQANAKYDEYRNFARQAYSIYEDSRHRANMESSR